MVSESVLEEALNNSWTRESSSDPDKWTPNNAAWGQCVVTALVVNDYLGGELVWANVSMPDGKEISHYFNKINGLEKDFTRVQFPSGAIIPVGVPKTKGHPPTREYVLSSPTTQTRYELLKSRVKGLIE